MKYSTIKQRAKVNRNNPTKAEKFFWSKVRKRQFLGYKFTRQYIFKYQNLEEVDLYFLLDFVCFSNKLVIEIDGKYHEKTKTYDRDRDDILQAYGWNVLHVTNSQVLSNWDKVENKLIIYLNEIKPSF